MEVKAKPFKLHVDFDDRIGALADARLRGQFDDLADFIENGVSVPDEFYRQEVDENTDRLLRAIGVKHLHLNGRTSDIIVYLVEFADQVVALLIANHAFLEDEPRGNLLKTLFGLPDW